MNSTREDLCVYSDRRQRAVRRDEILPTAPIRSGSSDEFGLPKQVVGYSTRRWSQCCAQISFKCVTQRRSSAGKSLFQFSNTNIRFCRQLKVRLTDVDDAHAAFLMHIENADQQDITPMERALSFQQQIEAKIFSTHDAMAEAFGVSKGKVAKLLKAARLLKGRAGRAADRQRRFSSI
jgi:single-stranded DNA-specific DHH superfamily exonuclease